MGEVSHLSEVTNVSVMGLKPRHQSSHLPCHATVTVSHHGYDDDHGADQEDWLAFRCHSSKHGISAASLLCGFNLRIILLFPEGNRTEMPIL